jgi:esterase/lipase
MNCPSAKAIILFVALITTWSCQSRVPSAHWPKECPKEITLEELNTSTFDLKERRLSQHHKTNQPQFVALVVHGLNLKPQKMEAIEEHLHSLGGETLRVALLGHRGSLDEQKQVTWNQWLEQFHDHYCLAKKRAQQLKIPMINISFSLGALVSLGHIGQQNYWPYQKLVMIAPAAWIHWYGQIPSWFSFLGGHLGLPSKNLESYRAEKTTSLAAYEAMAQGRSEVAGLSSELLKHDTLIVMDKDDELVSLRNIEEFIEEKKIAEKWQIHQVKNHNHQLKKSYHHLIIDQQSMGPDTWKSFTELVSSFLSLQEFPPKKRANSSGI